MECGKQAVVGEELIEMTPLKLCSDILIPAYLLSTWLIIVCSPLIFSSFFPLFLCDDVEIYIYLLIIIIN
jgi:hypothetical protein